MGGLKVTGQNCRTPEEQDDGGGETVHSAVPFCLLPRTAVLTQVYLRHALSPGDHVALAAGAHHERLGERNKRTGPAEPYARGPEGNRRWPVGHRRMLLDAIAALRADTNGKSRSADAAQALAQLRDRKLEKAALEEEIKASRRAVLVVNTLSRRGAYTYSEVKRQLKKAELILDAFPVRHPERIHEIVLDAIEQGRVLPLGTANSFACTLGIPLNLAGAIDVLINGKVADVDLGKINDDYFANGSSIGMPAVVGRATPHALKKWLGRAAYCPSCGE